MADCQQVEVYLLDLALLVLLGLVLLIITDFLLSGLFSPQADWIVDEFTVLFDQVLQSPLLQVLQLIFLEVQDDLCTSSQGFSCICTMSLSYLQGVDLRTKHYAVKQLKQK